MNTRTFLDKDSAQVDLIIAARIGDIDGAQRALNGGAGINDPLPDAKNIHTPLAHLLSEVDREESALFIAVRYGHQDIIKFLLHNNAHKLERFHSKTALHIAAEVGNVDAAFLLLEHGESPFAVDHDGNTPYTIALLKGNNELYKILLPREIKRDDVITMMIKRFNIAVKAGDAAGINKICDLLIANDDASLIYSILKNNLGTWLLNTFKAAPFVALLRLAEYIEAKQGYDCSSFLPKKYWFKNYYLKENIFAIIKKLPLIERLQKYDAILNTPNSIYYRLFHMKRNYLLGVDESRGVLHEIKLASASDLRKYKQIQEEEQQEKARQAQDKLDALAKVNSALMDAARMGDLTRIESSIKQGADVNHSDESIYIQYPIIAAALYGHVNAVKMLIEHGANVNATMQSSAYYKYENNGVSALFAAAQDGNLETVTYLLEHGAQTEIYRQFDYGSPLMIAVYLSHFHVIQTLLRHHAKIDTFRIKNNNYLSTLNIATRDGLEKVLDLLVEHMIQNYSIKRIMEFLTKQDNLKICYQRAGTNSALLAPLNKLLAHLIEHDVSREQLQAMLPAGFAIPLKQDTVTPTETQKMYPVLAQSSMMTTTAALQQYLDRAKQIQSAPVAEAIRNPFTDELLPTAVSPASVVDPFTAIDTILSAPQPSWLDQLAAIDFSQTATAVMTSPLADLISFPEPAKPVINPFDELIAKEQKPIAAKSGYVNPFAETEEERELAREATAISQLNALPPAPTGFGMFTIKKERQEEATFVQQSIAMTN